MVRRRGWPAYAGDTTLDKVFMQLLLARGVEAQIAYGAPIDARQFAIRADLALAAGGDCADDRLSVCEAPSELRAALCLGRRFKGRSVRWFGWRSDCPMFKCKMAGMLGFTCFSLG